MPNSIFARVELHERMSAKPDYNVLRNNMAHWQFSHQLVIDGQLKILPTGTYARVTPCPIDLAKDMVKFAADMTGFDNCGVVVGEDGFLAFDLESAPPRLGLLMAIPTPPSSVAPLKGLSSFLYGTKR